MTDKQWYDGLYEGSDDALDRGLAMLEDLRGALPLEKAGAVDEAKALLCRAAKIYKEMQAKVAAENEKQRITD